MTPLIGACVVLGLARAANLPRFYDAGLIVAMVLLGWGEVLGVYDSWRYYDNVVHTTVPLLLTGLLCVLLMRLDVLPELQDLTQLHQRIGFFLTALFFGMAIGAGWEIVEWTLDSTTGSTSCDQHDGYGDRPDLGHDRGSRKRAHSRLVEPRKPLAQETSWLATGA